MNGRSALPSLLLALLLLSPGSRRRGELDGAEEEHLARAAPAAKAKLDQIRTVIHGALAIPLLPVATAPYAGPPVVADYEDGGGPDFGVRGAYPELRFSDTPRWSALRNALGERPDAPAERGAAQELAALEAVRCVFVLRYQRRVEAVVAPGSFTPGHLWAEAHLFALDGGDLGGFLFEAKNSEQADASSPDRLEKDLMTQAAAAFREGAGRFGGGQITLAP